MEMLILCPFHTTGLELDKWSSARLTGLAVDQRCLACLPRPSASSLCLTPRAIAFYLKGDNQSLILVFAKKLAETGLRN